jgi:uncharacterized SAM-binding protein YcdF (DUF218 family)
MTDDEITRLLFLRDPPEPADLALVFGHCDPAVSAARVRHAVRLFRAGLVPELLVSGGATSGRDGETEAGLMARLAEEAGVPAGRILVEPRAANTLENITRSVALLRDRGRLDSLTSVILVSCPWHTGRVRLIAERSLPAGVGLACCPHADGFTAASWMRSGDGRLCVLAELRLFEAVRRALRGVVGS